MLVSALTAFYLHWTLIVRDHSFPRHTEFWAELWNLPVAAEFLCFCGILWNSVLASKRGGQIRHILVVFRWPYCMCMWFRHEIHDCQLGCNRRNVETLDLSLSEIFQVYLVDNCISQLQLLERQVLHICSGSGGCKNLLLYVENLPRWAAEFGKLAHGIWRNLPQKTVVPVNSDINSNKLLV